MRLKQLPYWPVNRKKRQYYFVDIDGKQHRCRKTIWDRLKIWKR